MHPHTVGVEGWRGAGRVGSDPIRRYSILARLPNRRDVAFGGNAERWEMRADRLGDVGRRQMRVMLFGHAGIGTAETAMCRQKNTTDRYILTINRWSPPPYPPP